MTDRELFRRAEEALPLAYAPYSKYRVGACLLSADGRSFTGVNVENAAYGAGICAERAALCKAVSEGAREFTAIAVAGSDSVAYPCGICRQMLSEFAPELRVIAGQLGGDFTVSSLDQLLPHSFGPHSLIK